MRLVAIVPGAGTLRARTLASLELGQQTLGGERARAREGGKLVLTLRLPRHLRHLAHTREGLYAVEQVSFHQLSRKVLRGELQVRFLVHRANRKRDGRR